MKKLAIAIQGTIVGMMLLLVAVVASASSITLLSGASAPVTGGTYTLPTASSNRTHSASLSAASSSVSASVTIQGSADSLTWEDLATIPLSLGTVDVNCHNANPLVQYCTGAPNQAAWPFERCNLTAISGVSATVDCKVGY